MLYRVIISDGQGNIKQVVTPEQLDKRFWIAIRASWKTGKQVNQKSVALCEICQEPYSFKTQKGRYCTACREEVNRRRGREYYHRKRKAVAG